MRSRWERQSEETERGVGGRTNYSRREGRTEKSNFFLSNREANEEIETWGQGEWRILKLSLNLDGNYGMNSERYIKCGMHK